MLNIMLGVVALITHVALTCIILSTQIISMYSHHQALPTGHLPLQKKLDILDIFITKIPNNLHCLTNYVKFKL